MTDSAVPRTIEFRTHLGLTRTVAGPDDIQWRGQRTKDLGTRDSLKTIKDI